jgi:hypothetical protein
MMMKMWNPSVVAGLVLLGASIVVQAEDVGWMSDCSSAKDWYDDKANQSFHTKVDQFEPSVLRVTQQGADTWGKAAFVVQDIDLDKTPILQTKVNKVDINSAFKVCVASLDWSEIYEVVPRSSADGIHMGDIKTATGWSGKKSFNIVVVIEGQGKASYFDQIKIASKS